MTMKCLTIAFATTLAASLLSFASPALAFGGSNVPACDAPQVLSYIQKRFVWNDRHVLKRGLAIETIDRVHRNRSRYGDQYWSIPRLYCHGTAYMNLSLIHI